MPEKKSLQPMHNSNIDIYLLLPNMDTHKRVSSQYRSMPEKDGKKNPRYQTNRNGAKQNN